MVQSIHLTGRVISSSAYLFSLKQTINAGLMTYKAISENLSLFSVTTCSKGLLFEIR